MSEQEMDVATLMDELLGETEENGTDDIGENVDATADAPADVSSDEESDIDFSDVPNGKIRY